MRLKKAKFKLLHLAQCNSQYQYRLWGKEVQNSATRKDLAVLVDERHKMTCNMHPQTRDPAVF